MCHLFASAIAAAAIALISTPAAFAGGFHGGGTAVHVGGGHGVTVIHDRGFTGNGFGNVSGFHNNVGIGGFYGNPVGLGLGFNRSNLSINVGGGFYGGNAGLGLGVGGYGGYSTVNTGLGAYGANTSLFVGDPFAAAQYNAAVVNAQLNAQAIRAAQLQAAQYRAAQLNAAAAAACQPVGNFQLNINRGVNPFGY